MAGERGRPPAARHSGERSSAAGPRAATRRTCARARRSGPGRQLERRRGARLLHARCGPVKCEMKWPGVYRSAEGRTCTHRSKVSLSGPRLSRVLSAPCSAGKSVSMDGAPSRAGTSHHSSSSAWDARVLRAAIAPTLASRKCERALLTLSARAAPAKVPALTPRQPPMSLPNTAQTSSSATTSGWW